MVVDYQGSIFSKTRWPPLEMVLAAPPVRHGEDDIHRVSPRFGMLGQIVNCNGFGIRRLLNTKCQTLGTITRTGDVQWDVADVLRGGSHESV